MKTLVRIFVVALLLVSATAEFVFGQGMVYQTHQAMTLAAADGLAESWVKLPNNNYVRTTYGGGNSIVESSSGWTVSIQNSYQPRIAQHDGTIWCAVRQNSTNTVIVGSFTFPPTGQGTVVLVKISSDGSVLNAWQASGNMALRNIAIKDNNEIAVVGSAGTVLEHLTSPNGGGVVLIHNGNDWDNSKGFFIERPSGGFNPIVVSAQYLSNGNLALAGFTEGGTVSFGGISLPPHGGEDGFRGEITPSGIGVSAVQMAGNGDEDYTLQSTKADGSFMVTGTYTQAITFYNADGSVGGALGQFPTGCSHDNVYFAYYNASGVFQNAEVVYNAGCTTDMLNIDLVYGNNAFYAMVGNTNGGTVTTPTGTHNDAGPIILKFDNTGNPVWSKQFQNVSGPVQFQYGEEILVTGDIVTLCGSEYIACDLDFNSGVLSISNTSYWAEYFDGTIVGPTADFSGTPLNGECPLNVSFTDLSVAGTNGISSWTWTFEGGTPGTYSGQNPPAIVYNSAGTYDVTLVVSDGSLSDTEVKTDYITVTAPPPSASYTPNATQISASSGNVYSNFETNEVSAVNVLSGDPGTAVNPINMGTGTTNVELSYPLNSDLAAKQYVVTATTAPNNLVVTWTVNQDGATPSMALNPASATVNADATSTSTDLTTQGDMSWTVDDSGLPTGWSVAPLSGTGNASFVVTMTVNTGTDPVNGSFTINGTGAGAGTSVSFPITQLGAGAPLVASASSDKSVYTLGQTIQLYGSATGGTGNYSYEWTGTGGFTSTLQNPIVTPSSEGSYTYTLIVNDGSNTDTDNVVVGVWEVSFYLEATPMNGTTDDEFLFHSELIQNSNDPRTVDYHSIEFGDGEMFEGTGNIVEVVHTYLLAGTYDIEQSYVLSDGSTGSKTNLNFIGVITDVTETEIDKIKIYPNPTSGNINITGKSIERLSIVDMNGREVIHQENLGGMTQIDLSKLPNGLYFVRLMVGGVFTTQKVVKR